MLHAKAMVCTIACSIYMECSKDKLDPALKFDQVISVGELCEKTISSRLLDIDSVSYARSKRKSDINNNDYGTDLSENSSAEYSNIDVTRSDRVTTTQFQLPVRQKEEVFKAMCRSRLPHKYVYTKRNENLFL